MVRLEVLRNGLSVGLLVGLLACASTKSFYNSRASILFPWSGKYIHTSGGFELVLQQFEKDLLAVDIVKVPESNQEDVFASFFAVIKNDVAISRDRTDPNCRYELRLLNEAVEFSDFCHPVGHQNTGLYLPVTSEVASKRVMR